MFIQGNSHKGGPNGGIKGGGGEGGGGIGTKENKWVYTYSRLFDILYNIKDLWKNLKILCMFQCIYIYSILGGSGKFMGCPTFIVHK